MNNLLSGFQEEMELIATMLAVGYFNGVFKVAVGPELEKRLRRKPTDWDWLMCLEDISKKAESETQQKMLKAQQDRLNDRKIIHDFVWSNEINYNLV